MSIGAGIERPFNTGIGQFPEQPRVPAVSGTTLNGYVTGQTISLFDTAATFTTVTATIYQAAVVLPRNLPVYQLGVIVTTTGTVTGFWQALATQGGIVRAVSANTTAPTTGFFNQPVLPANAIPYVTEYAGLYYFCLGTVSSVATVVAAATAAPSAATFAGPPVYAGTNATAATVTPPAVGTQLGAITGGVNLIYGQTA